MIIEKKDKSYDYYYSVLKSKLNIVSPLYSKLAGEYYSQRPILNGITFRDASFIFVENENPIFCLQGLFKVDKDIVSLVFYEIPCICIEDQDLINKKIEKKIIKKFEQIHEVVGSNIFYKDFLVNNNISIFTKFLLSKGFQMKYSMTRVLDLHKSKTELKLDIRKSYKSLINWGDRELKKEIYTYTNITKKQIEEFRTLHFDVSGRYTRPIESWNKQFDIIKNNEGFVVLGYYNELLVTAGFFIFNEFSCIYGSSASKRELFEKPLFHSVMWDSILHAKKIGCNFFDIGEQNLDKISQNKLSNKELDIEKFKSGFGGCIKLNLISTQEKNN